MKIAAVTMVYRDYWALSQWYRHFGRHLGQKNLYIIAHGADPEIARLCPQANVVTVPRDRLDNFDRFRSRTMNKLRFGLLGLYDWVIQTDADELICLDPDRYPSFAAMFDAQTAPALFGLGLYVAERANDQSLEPRQAAMHHRASAIFSGHYSKAWASAAPVAFARHGLLMNAQKTQTRPMVLPRGVYLAHLKYANIAVLPSVNAVRKSVSTGPGKRLPGPAWQKPGQRARKFFAEFEALTERPWDEAEAEAYAQITTDPLRDTAKGILRARNLRFPFRTTIPERIGRF